MGLKLGTLASPEFQCLEQLKHEDWPQAEWRKIFARCGNNADKLNRKQAAHFFAELFKYLELEGSSGHFVAGMMSRLGGSKSELVWQDILRLQLAENLKSVIAGEASSEIDLSSRIVKLSELYENYQQNKDMVQSALDHIHLGQKRQDVGLKEAFLATMDTLVGLYELDLPVWNNVKKAAYVSFVKKTLTTNTSVTSGIAASLLSPGKEIGILNCGTGPLKFQFYKMDAKRVVRVLIDFTPEENQELYILHVRDEGKREVLRKGIKLSLSYLNKKQIPVAAIVTGELRETWAKGTAAERLSLEADLHNLFHSLKVKPCGLHGNSYFLPQDLEGKLEDLACGNLIRDVAPQYDVFVSLGIGRGTCQWATRLSTIGHKFGMNAPEKLVGTAEVSLKKTVLEAFTPKYVSELAGIVKAFELPTIALKSGCLLLLDRMPEVMQVLTRSPTRAMSQFTGFGPGQTLVTKFGNVIVENMQASGHTTVNLNGKSLTVQLDWYSTPVPSTVFAVAVPSTDEQTLVARLRRKHAEQHLSAGYFALLQNRAPKHKFLSSAPLSYQGHRYGTAFCSGEWESWVKTDDVYFEFDHELKSPLIELIDRFLTFKIELYRTPVDLRVRPVFVACFPIGCALSFGVFTAINQGLDEQGDYIWRIEDWGYTNSPAQVEGFTIEKGTFRWPTVRCDRRANICTMYSYKPHVKLMVQLENEGHWVNAEVVRRLEGNWHELTFESSEIESRSFKLTDTNHTWDCIGSQLAFADQLASYQSFLSETYQFVEDAISGKKMRTSEQLVTLQIEQVAKGDMPFSDVRELVQQLCRRQAKRMRVVILATAGTGKTSTMRQLMYFAAESRTAIVPILIVVQRLANFIRKSPAAALEMCNRNFVEYYLRQEFLKPLQLEFLLQAVRMREVLIAIDGLDEAADYASQLYHWINTQLDQHHVIATSRPQGFEPRPQTTIANLNELSAAQQRRIIELQLNDNAYYNSLLAFSNTRTAQDDLYSSMDAAARDQVERLKSFDKVKKSSGSRQRGMTGDLLSFHEGAAVSVTLQRRNEALLHALALKLKLPKDQLWAQIVRATDPLYQVAEFVQGSVKRWLEDLCAQRRIPASCLEFSKSLKEPVRVYEKAQDDYKQEFNDDVPPTACVMDVIRCRLLLEDLKTKVDLVTSLINEAPTGVSVVRLKNKYDPSSVDAAHLRNFLMNFMVRFCTSCGKFVDAECSSCGGGGPVSSHIFEVQIYHKQIYQLCEELQQHHHYEALRTMLREDAMRNQVDFILDRQVILFEDVGKVPVLLSMLVLVLGEDHCLPTNMYELYHLAIQSAIRRFAVRAKSTNTDNWEISVYHLLQVVAFQAQDAGVVAITQNDLVKWNINMSLWDEICGVGQAYSGNVTFSVIKVISQNAEYRFAHLSFQEFLYVEYLRSHPEHVEAAMLNMISNPRFSNVKKIVSSSQEVMRWLFDGELPSNEDEFCRLAIRHIIRRFVAQRAKEAALDNLKEWEDSVCELLQIIAYASISGEHVRKHVRKWRDADKNRWDVIYRDNGEAKRATLPFVTIIQSSVEEEDMKFEFSHNTIAKFLHLDYVRTHPEHTELAISSMIADSRLMRLPSSSEVMRRFLLLEEGQQLPNNDDELYRLVTRQVIRRFAARVAKMTPIAHIEKWEDDLHKLLQAAAFQANQAGRDVFTEHSLNELGTPDRDNLWVNVPLLKYTTEDTKRKFEFVADSVKKYFAAEYYFSQNQHFHLNEVLSKPWLEHAMRHLCASPERLQSLVPPDQSHLFVPDVDVKMSFVFVELLKQLPSLQSLTVHYKADQTEVPPAIPQAVLNSRLPPLREIRLDVVHCVMPSNVRVLDLSQNRLTVADINALCGMLPQLEWLDLGGNHIRSLATITNHLRVNAQLKFIGLAKMFFPGVEDVRQFSSMLQHNRTLTQWHLSSVFVSQDEIAASFEEMSGLQYFSGSWIRNNLADEDNKKEEVRSNTKQVDDASPIQPLWSEEQLQSMLVHKMSPELYYSAIVYGKGSTSLTALLAELLPFGDPLSSVSADHVRTVLLKSAQVLARAIPHYGYKLGCSAEDSTRSKCKELEESKLLDGRCAELILALVALPEAKNVLVAASKGYCEFPSWVLPLISKADLVARDDYVPSLEDQLWSTNREFQFTLDGQRFRFVLGHNEFIQNVNVVGGNYVIVVAADPGEINEYDLALSRDCKVIAYNPHTAQWTIDSFLFGGNRAVYQANNLKDTCTQILRCVKSG